MEGKLSTHTRCGELEGKEEVKVEGREGYIQSTIEWSGKVRMQRHDKTG